MLAVNDSGTISLAFNPDGTLRATGERAIERQENVPLILREGISWSLGRPSCPQGTPPHEMTNTRAK